jgi:hypothetical protein
MLRLDSALHTSWRLIDASVRIAHRCERTARHRPVRTSRHLYGAAARLSVASDRLISAVTHIRKMNECMATEANLPFGPELVLESLQRWTHALVTIEQTSATIDTMQETLLASLKSGDVDPAALTEVRRRIRLTPPPAPIRTFLLVRQPRVTDRITPLLRRRRRTPRPAEIRVPGRSLLGRAPPSFSIALA